MVAGLEPRFPFCVLEELLHLLLGRGHRLELARAPEAVDQPVLQRRTALLIGQPAPVLLGRLEPGLLELVAVVHFGREVAAHLPHLLLHPVGDFLVGHLDGGVARGLLHQQLLVHDSRDHFAPKRLQPLLFLGELGALGLAAEQLLVHLGREHRAVAHHGHDPIHHDDRVRRHGRGLATFGGSEPPRGRAGDARRIAGAVLGAPYRQGYGPARRYRPASKPVPWYQPDGRRHRRGRRVRPGGVGRDGRGRPRGVLGAEYPRIRRQGDGDDRRCDELHLVSPSRFYGRRAAVSDGARLRRGRRDLRGRPRGRSTGWAHARDRGTAGGPPDRTGAGHRVRLRLRFLRHVHGAADAGLIDLEGQPLAQQRRQRGGQRAEPAFPSISWSKYCSILMPATFSARRRRPWSR